VRIQCRIRLGRSTLDQIVCWRCIAWDGEDGTGEGTGESVHRVCGVVFGFGSLLSWMCGFKLRDKEERVRQDVL
jgi:hypothetical protein